MFTLELGGKPHGPQRSYHFSPIIPVLVWQDFLFGCGIYPANESFLESVQEEAVQAVKRLRHHPSLVLFGNVARYIGYML